MNELQTIQSKISDTSGEIVMYQPDETIRLEVRLGEDTVWLRFAIYIKKKNWSGIPHVQNLHIWVRMVTKTKTLVRNGLPSP